MNVVVALLGITVALLAALVISLLRSHADVLRALDEMGVSLDPDQPDAPASRTSRTRSGTTQSEATDPVTSSGTVHGVPSPAQMLGHAAVDITGVTPQGDAASIGTDTGDILLAFLSSGCVTCHRFWEAFATGEQLDDGRLADGTRVVVVTQGVESESPSTLAGLSTPDVPVIMSTDAWEDFGVPIAPYFALVVGGRVVGEGAAAQWSQVASLLERAREDAAMHADAALDDTPAGDSAPRSRRSVLTGNRDRIDADLMAAGIRPGDPRLTHTAADVGLGEPTGSDPDDQRSE